MPPYSGPTASERGEGGHGEGPQHFCKELNAQLQCTACGRQLRFADNVIAPPMIYTAINIDPGTVDMRHCDCSDACMDTWREQSCCRCDKPGMDNPHVRWRCVFHNARNCGNFYTSSMVRPPQEPKLPKPPGRIMLPGKTCGVCEAGPGNVCVCF